MIIYESGKNIPCAYRLTQIADFYKVTPNDLLNPNYIHEQTRDNELLDKGLTLQDVVDKGLTPQDAGYLKPQKDIGSFEEIVNEGISDEEIEKVDYEHERRILKK